MQFFCLSKLLVNKFSRIVDFQDGKEILIFYDLLVSQVINARRNCNNFMDIEKENSLKCKSMLHYSIHKNDKN